MRRLLAYSTNVPMSQERIFPSIQALAIVVVDHCAAGWDIYEITAGSTEPILAAITKRKVAA